MHAVELTSVPTENRAVVVVHGLDLVLASPPHLNSDLAWIQRTGVFTLRYPLVLSASIVLEYCAWTLSVNIANVLISSVSQIQRRIQGRGPGAQDPLSVRPNWGPKGRKKCFGDCPPTYLRVWMPPPYLNVWMRHWNWPGRNDVVALRRYFPSCFINNTCLFGSNNSWLQLLPTLVMVVSQSETDKSQR